MKRKSSFFLLGALAIVARLVGAQPGRDESKTVPILTEVAGRAPVRTGKAIILVKDKPIDFGGVPLLNSRGRLMVPLRPFGEAVGAKVSFDPSLGEVRASLGGSRLQMMGDFPLVEGRMMFPLRALSEALGIRVAMTQKGDVLRVALDAPTGPNTALFNATRNRFPSRREPSSGRPISPTPASPSAPVPTVTDAGITQADIQYNLDRINAYRARAGVPPVALDAALCAFARQGSLELLQNHEPHGHFRKSDVWKSGFQGGAAENQGDPNGWSAGPVTKSVDEILKMMIDEGPGGGHHDNMLNPTYKRVGIGLVKDNAGQLYLTNDFSG